MLPGFRHASRSRSKPCERRPQPAFSQDSCGSSMGFMSGSSSTLLPVQNLRRAQRHHLKQPCRHCQSMAWLSGLARFSGETWSCVTAFSCDSGSQLLSCTREDLLRHKKQSQCDHGTTQPHTYQCAYYSSSPLTLGDMSSSRLQLHWRSPPALPALKV